VIQLQSDDLTFFCVVTKLNMTMGHDVDRLPLCTSTTSVNEDTRSSTSTSADCTAALLGLTVAPAVRHELSITDLDIFILSVQ
jgi:hypothetical protein